MRTLFICAIVLTSIYAVDGPPLKEGYWSIHTVTIDQPGNKKSEGTRSICRNHAYDAHTRALGNEAKAKCKVNQETLVNGKLTTDMECTVAGSVLHSKGTATMASDSSHSETVTTYTPAMYGQTESTMIMDQKYVGACPAGIQPGDSVSQDGRVTHLWKH